MDESGEKQGTRKSVRDRWRGKERNRDCNGGRGKCEGVEDSGRRRFRKGDSEGVR